MAIINVFITGKIKVGKTSVLNEILHHFKDINIGGFRTIPLFEGEIRKGFALKSFAGEEKIFAHTDLKTQDTLSDYHYDINIFETFAVSVLQRAKDESDLIVMDEIGVMERKAEKFKQEIVACLDADTPVLGVFQQRADWFAALLQARKDTKIFHVDEDNRDKVADLIINEFRPQK